MLSGLRFRYSLIYPLLFLCFIKTQTYAQSIIATLNILPPYTASLPDYSDVPNKVMINLTNNSFVGGNANVYVRIDIESVPEGIHIYTLPSMKPAQPIILIPSSLKTLMGNDIKSILGIDKLGFNGITKADILKSGLPEGTYRFCVQVYDFNSNSLVNAEGSGCMIINITNASPPVILNPVCGDSVHSFIPQQVIFSWTPPAGIPVINIKYAIRITEVLPDGKDPAQAMSESTYPYFYELQNLSTNTFVYGPAQPTLHKGRTYAFTITATDNLGKTFIKNGGASEVCSFKYGSTDTNEQKKNFPKQVDTSGKLATSISGKLYYSYNEDPNQSFILKNTQIKLKLEFVKKESSGGKYKYKKASINYTNYQLISSLKKASEKPNLQKNIQNLQIQQNTQSNQYAKLNTDNFLIQSSNIFDAIQNYDYITTTNNNGEFSFIIKLAAADTASWIPDPQNPSEKLYKVYSLELFNPYYDNPSTTFELKPGVIKELGSVVAPVKTYNLNVNVQQLYQSTKGKILDGMTVFLLRKTKNTDLPEMEGDIGSNYPVYFGYKVIAKAKTEIKPANKPGGIQENSVTFFHLVANLQPGDEYILYTKQAGPTPQSDFYSISYYASDKNSDLINYSYKPASNSNPPKMANKTLYCIFQNPPVSKVTGTLKYQFPGNNLKVPKPLQNMKVSLVVQYKFTGIFSGHDKSFIVNSSYIIPGDLPGGFQMPSDNGQILDTKNTDQNGYFSLNFYNIDSVKIVNKNFNSPSSDVMAHYSGKLERVYRVIVQSPFYCSPDDDIKVQPWNNYDAGTLYSDVVNYQLKIKIKLDASFLKSMQRVQVNPDSSISGVKVSLYRLYFNPDLPPDEAQGINKQDVLSGQNVKLVAQGVNADDGSITFDDCIRSTFIDDHYIIHATTSEYSGTVNYYPRDFYYPSINPNKRLKEAVISPTSNVYIYNSEYNNPGGTSIYYLTNKYYVEVGMMPKGPRVAGRVISVAAPNGVKTAQVKLKEHFIKLNSYDNIVHLTDTAGYFSFDNLLTEVQDVNNVKSDIIGPERTLMITKDGYEDYSNNLGVMKIGAMFADQVISIKPFGVDLKGVVRDSMPNINNSDLKGDPITAKVRIEGGPWINTYNCYPYECQWDQQIFKLNAPTGDNQKLTIVPFDPAYPPRTFLINIKKGNNWLGYFEFNKMKHKVKIRVIKKPPQGQYSYIPHPVFGATVTILDMTKTTDFQGYAYFEFVNNSITNFSAKVTPTANNNFVPVNYGFTNVETTNIQSYVIGVDEAITVNGKVTSATGNHPLVGAKVFVDQGNTVDQYVALTDANGNYSLKGVPKNPVKPTIRAVYDDNGTPPKTYIGKSKQVLIPSTGNLNNVNFALSIYDKMDLNQIMGFDIEIDSLKEISNGVVEISGGFVNVPENPNFKLLNPKMRLPFSKMRVVAGKVKNSNNIPYGEPNVMPYGIDLQVIPIRIFNFYNGELRITSGTSVLKFEKDYPSGKAMITGLIRIVDNSFNFPSSYMTFTKQDFYLGNYAQNTTNDKMKLPAFKPASVNYPKKRFCLAKWDGKPIEFTLLGFQGAAFTGPGANESYISGDTVGLFMKLYATIPYDPPMSLNIDAGKILLFHDHIDPIDNNNDINFNLEKWQVKGKGWKLSTNSGGIVIKTGAIKTGVVDVPFDEMSINPNELVCTKYKLSNLTLAGVTNFNVNTSIPDDHKIFIYDPRVGDDQKGHYKLLIISDNNNIPVATFGGTNILEGMSGNDVFRIKVISLISNGEQIFSFGADHPQVRIYKVAYFTPLTVTSYDNYFKLYGLVDLKIPRVAANQTLELTYKPGGGPMAKLVCGNIATPFTGPGNVDFSSGVNQHLDNNGFVTDGTISEKGIFILNCKLYRPADDKIPKDTIHIDVDPVTQTMAISTKSELRNVHGKMKVENGDWTYFWFKGELHVTQGLDAGSPQILKFTVYGEIKADGQSIGVKNIPTNFGGMSLTYDFANSRLIGSLNFSQDFSSVKLTAVLEVVVDGAGWYFIAGGTLTSPGIGTVNAGMMIGDYGNFPPTMQSTLMQFAYDKNIPCDFLSGVHGFFFTGSKTLPISIPSTDINVGVFAIKFGAEAGLDARLYMNFSGNGNVYGIGAMVFAHAWLSLESVTCTTISADAKAEMKLAAEYNTKTKTCTGTACTSIGISASISQGVPSFAGCVPVATIGFDKSFHVSLTLDNSGMKDFSFGSGNCSDPSPNPCNQ